MRLSLLVFLFGLYSTLAFGQQPPADQQGQDQHQHGQQQKAQEHHDHGAMTASTMDPREASGTAWQPRESPIYGVHRQWKGWDVMFHGNVFGQFLYEPGDIHRTGGEQSTQVSSVNWGMAMLRREVRGGRLGLRSMLAVEPWTVGDCGFINLLASGETCDGDAIHDRQHPHDLLMELAADYDRPLRGSVRWQIYGGLSGEPELGPPGFPHRVSSLPNPAAPISHHWIDSTHIAFGLVTGALYGPRWKTEFSVFNGREPDENRADLDLAPLDSFSGRMAFLPTPGLALQISAAHLEEAEVAHAGELPIDVARVTASGTYHRLAGASVWATTLAYGTNGEDERHLSGDITRAWTHAFLVETNYTRDERHSFFGRGEIAQKPAHDLDAHELGDRTFGVGKMSGGYTRYMTHGSGVSLGVGGFVSAAIVPRELTDRYVRRVAPGIGFFVTLRPPRHTP